MMMKKDSIDFPLEDLVSRSSIKVKWEKQLEKEGKEGRCNISFLCYKKNDKSQNVSALGNDPTEKKALGIEYLGIQSLNGVLE